MDKHYNNIKNLIENNLIEVRKNEISSNYHTLMTYFNVGKNIVEAQGGREKAKYGDNLIKEYSIKLTNKFGKGYDESNLKRMRLLYLTFEKSGTLSHQLNWSHYNKLLTIKNESKRNYYINCVIEHNFSVRQLREYIKSNAYERLVNKENIQLKHDNTSEANILDMIKNPILIRIDKNIDKITEKALKQFMLSQIEQTMLELGVGFAFVGSEIPIKLGNKTHKPDLVFFNINLNCYVIFEIKLKELKKIDVGQLEFYVKYYDSEIKKYFHNPTIGITISNKIDYTLTKYIKKDNIEHITYNIIDENIKL